MPSRKALLVGAAGAVVVGVALAVTRKGGPPANVVALMPAARAAAQAAGVPVEWVLALSLKESKGNFNAVARDPWDHEAGAGAYGPTQVLYTTATGLGYKGPAPNPPPRVMVDEINALPGAVLHPKWQRRGANAVWSLQIKREPNTPAAHRAGANIVQKYLDKSLGGSTRGGWLPYRPSEGLLNPATSMLMTARLLAQHKRRFGNDFRDVASAWNSGKPYSQLGPENEYTRKTYIPEILAVLDKVRAAATMA